MGRLLGIYISILIERRHKCSTISHKRFCVAFRNEIISIFRVSIAHACTVFFPRHRSLGVKQFASGSGVCGYLLEVVGLSKILGSEFLWLQRTAISIHLHLGQVAESSLLHNLRRQLVNSAFAHPNLRPSSFPQHTVLGISLTCCGSCCGSLP